MTRFILDTGILLGIVRKSGFAKYVEKKYRISESPNTSFVSVASVAELESLVYQFGWGESKQNMLAETLAKFPKVVIDMSVVKTFADIVAFSQGKHPKLRLPDGMSARNMGDNDIWIAATAVSLKATLITLDRDFDHLCGVFLDLIYIDQKLTEDDV